MFLASPLILLLLSYTRVVTCDSFLQARAGCNDGYTKCSPNGAATTNEPAVGTGLASMYVDVVNSVQGSGKQIRDLDSREFELQGRASGGSLCSQDNYTTNYYLPGGSYAQLASGTYTGSDGSKANLISGNYTLADGTVGNIYCSPSSPSKPDTATLNLPTQYTAAGSGSAIPATALGEEITYVTTIPGTTVPPSTITGLTISPIIIGGSTAPAITTEETTTISGAPTVADETIGASIIGGSTESPGTTVSATTISGTIIAPKISTVVTRVAASATKKSAGSRIKTSAGELVGVLVVLAVFAHEM